MSSSVKLDVYIETLEQRAEDTLTGDNYRRLGEWTTSGRGK